MPDIVNHTIGIAAEVPLGRQLLEENFPDARVYESFSTLKHDFDTGVIHIAMRLNRHTLVLETVWGQRTLSKPFALTDVMTFVNKASSRLSQTYTIEHALFDPLTHTLFHPKIKLSEKESALLICLLKAPKGGLKRSDILQKVWGYDERLDTRTLDTHIYQLRQKIEKCPATPIILVSTPSGYEIPIERVGKVPYNLGKAC